MKRNAEWLRELRTGKENIKQNDIKLTTEMVKEQVRKISNWKSQDQMVFRIIGEKN